MMLHSPTHLAVSAPSLVDHHISLQAFMGGREGAASHCPGPKLRVPSGSLLHPTLHVALESHVIMYSHPS